MKKIIAFLLVLITFINCNISFIYAIEQYEFENNEFESDYIDDLGNDELDDTEILENDYIDDIDDIDYEFDFDPNFEFDYETFELDLSQDIDNYVAITGTLAYSTYLATNFIAAAGVTLGVGAAAVAGTHFLDSVASDTAYVFTQMATDIYNTTGDFVTGVNINVKDFMSEADFTKVMNSVRDVFNPANPEFYPLGDGLVHGNMALDQILMPLSTDSFTSSDPNFPFVFSRSFGKQMVVPNHFSQAGQVFSVVSDGTNFRIVSTNGVNQNVGRVNNATIIDVNLGIVYNGSTYLATYVETRMGTSSHPLYPNQVFYTFGGHTFANWQKSILNVVNPALADGFTFGYTDQLLNPTWDWAGTNVGTGTIDRPMVLHPPGTIDLDIGNVTVANPDYPWVVTDTGVINPPLDPPLNPPLDPPVGDLSWLDRVMGGFDSVVGATTAGATSVVGAVNTGVTSLTNTLTTGFTNTVSAVNTGFTSITSSITNAFTWFTAPATNQIDFSPLQISLEDVFPFSLPFDIYKLLVSFRADAKAPMLDVDFNMGVLGVHNVKFDFSPYNFLAVIIRYFLLLGYIVSLIKITNGLIGRGGG